MKETISLKELFQILKKRFWLIILITVIVSTASAVVSYFILTPVYESKTQLLVNQAKSEQQLYDSTEIQTNIQLINTYNVIIKSPVILEKVKDGLKLNKTVEDLNNQIKVSSATNSQVVEITVQDTSKKMANQIANETAKVFQEEIVKIMNIDNVSILSKDEVVANAAPVKPKPLINIGLGVLIGLILGVGLSLLIEYLDNTLKTEQDIENILGLPVIGVVTNIKDVPKPSNVSRPDVAARVPQRGETYGS
ncbi:Wzz/FepE/Etk N-terminal domain-containing protein [Priestia aryabhattai]|uniref:YveK family protein n=1 Tax=Priestia aryabhattai TaxID=412384 RepID=UPI003D2B0789